MDTIFIHDLRVETRIGVYAWEQDQTQPLLLDVEFAVPSERPFASDKLDDAVDYARVVARLQALAAEHPHKLLERFAEAVASILRSEFAVPWVRVKVAKLAPIAGVRQVGVTVERGARS
jgi:dihydroneopterin aldolase